MDRATSTLSGYIPNSRDEGTHSLVHSGRMYMYQPDDPLHLSFCHLSHHIRIGLSVV